MTGFPRRNRVVPHKSGLVRKSKSCRTCPGLGDQGLGVMSGLDQHGSQKFSRVCDKEKSRKRVNEQEHGDGPVIHLGL